VLRAYRLIAQAGASADSALLRLTDGAVWAILGTRPSGARYVLFASPLSTDATTLPTSAALVPLLDRLLGAWIAVTPSITEASPGQEIALPPGTDSVRSPTGVTEVVRGTWNLGQEAGVYTLLSSDSISGMVAVNPPPLESDLARADAARLRAALPGADVVTTDRARQWDDRIFRERVGREVWRILVLAALAVLFVEAMVGATGAAGRRAAGSNRGRTAQAGD
jgi:hypothetical protein